MKDKSLFVTVRGREGVLFEGNAKTVSSVNDKGKFDVLSLHSNYISLIKGKLTIVQTNGQIKEIPVENGVIRVVNNVVDVYLGIKQPTQ